MPNATRQLSRDTQPSSKPSELRRLPTVQRATMAVALPQVDSPSRSSADLAEPSGAVRDIAGAQLAGPVADRELVFHAKPEYPEWAKRDGVEASLTLRFYVLPNGQVKRNILIEKASGFTDFDKNAILALQTWRFEALRGSADQWGRITFHYRLSDAH